MTKKPRGFIGNITGPTEITGSQALRTASWPMHCLHRKKCCHNFPYLICATAQTYQFLVLAGTQIWYKYKYTWPTFTQQWTVIDNSQNMTLHNQAAHKLLILANLKKLQTKRNPHFWGKKTRAKTIRSETYRYTIQVPRPLLAQTSLIVGGVRLNQQRKYGSEQKNIH